MSEDKDIILLNEADKALALATSVPEMRALRDTFTSAKAWAKSRGLGVEAENKASEYILRTERKIGAELIRMAETGERNLGRPAKGSHLETLSELGIEKNNAERWQLVARVSDEEFEALLNHSKAARERIAKINFYRKSHKRRGDGTPETPPDKGFAMFRAGAYHLLGWRVDDDGVGTATKNGLLLLPRDELASFAEIVQLLVTAYGEARKARS